MPKVSVIVPVYNAEKYIGRCIESVQAQSMTEWELILVDDYSEDRSVEVMKHYSNKDKRIIVQTLDNNHGPMIARRNGDEIAKGSYITYCDGDDCLPCNALQLLLEKAIETGADIVSGNFTYFKTNGEKCDCISKLNYGNNGENLLKALLKKDMKHILCSKLFKSEIIKDHDYIFVDHMCNGEDGYLFYQMVPYINSIIQIPDIVYYYVQNSSSSSQRRLSEKALDNILLMNSMRIALIDDYPSLKKDIICYVSGSLNELIINGYNKDGRLQKLMEKHELLEYSKDKTVCATHSFNDSVRILFMKHVVRYYKEFFRNVGLL